MPFVKGQSGNPAGRPLGARNKATLAIEAQLEARAEEIVGVAVKRAVLGDPASLRMCLDRILPRGRDRPVPFVLPPLVGADAAERAVEGIRVAIGTGELTIPEALGLLQIVEKATRIVAAARPAQYAGAQEATAMGAEAFDAAKPAAAGPRGNRQTTEETIKYNEPLRAGHGAGGSGSPGEEEQAENTMKCNEPAGPANGAAQSAPCGGEQGTEETTKCNDPHGKAEQAGKTTKYNDGAPVSPPRGKDQQTRRATKYNGPPGLLDGVAHFILPSAGTTRPIVPLARAVPPKLSSAA